MSAQSTTKAATAVNGCPACRDAVHTQRQILAYRRPYLCDADKAVWDAADARERAA